MALAKLFMTLFGLFGKKNEKKEVSLEEMKLQDAIRKEKKLRQDKMKEEKKLNEEKTVKIGRNPWEKAARMLRTEKRRQRMIAETEGWEKQEREKEERRKKRAERERYARLEREESIRRVQQSKKATKQQQSKMQDREISKFKQGYPTEEEVTQQKKEERELVNVTIQDGPYIIRHRVKLIKLH